MGLFSACAGGNAPPVSEPDPPDPHDAIAEAIISACPPSAPDDEEARASCAGRLAANPVLEEVMGEPFLWGMQAEDGSVALEDGHLTRFNPFVWRRLYLSLFMFTGPHRVTHHGEVALIHLPIRFRGALDPGSYPYPFWHSAKKWRDYQLAAELLLVVKDGKVSGAMRSAERGKDYVATDRAWDGQWTWKDGEEPVVTLYRSLFSTENPHVAPLEVAYRELEDALRPHACVTCHSPSNTMAMNPLELVVYPNQTLAGRDRIVAALEANTMPPATATRAAGIHDPAEREALLTIARKFQQLANEALAYETKPAGAAAPRRNAGTSPSGGTVASGP